MREGFLHASWILALGMGWSISSLAEELPPVERVHRPAIARSRSAVSALEVENTPEKLFVRLYQRVLNHRDLRPNQVIGFRRIRYNTTFETECHERGILHADSEGRWMMATQPVAYASSQVSGRIGKTGLSYRLSDGNSVFISVTKNDLVFANIEEKIFRGDEIRFNEPYGFFSLNGFLKISRHPQVILFCWPFSPDETTVKLFASHWKWSTEQGEGSWIRFHAQPREATENAGFSSFDLIIDRSIDRIVGIKVGDSSESIETVYVEVARNNPSDSALFAIPGTRGLLPSKSGTIIPGRDDFRRAGYREILPQTIEEFPASALRPLNTARERSVWTRDYDQMSHPVYYQPPVSALRPLNMPDPRERSAWNLIWKVGVALGRWPAAGLFHYAAGLGA